MIQILCCENSCVGTLTTCSEVRASEEQAEGGKKLKQKETAKIQYKCHIIIDGDVSFYPYLHIHICLYACCVYACFVYMHVVCMHVLCICMLYVCMHAYLHACTYRQVPKRMQMSYYKHLQAIFKPYLLFLSKRNFQHYVYIS